MDSIVLCKNAIKKLLQIQLGGRFPSLLLYCVHQKRFTAERVGDMSKKTFFDLISTCCVQHEVDTVEFGLIAGDCMLFRCPLTAVSVQGGQKSKPLPNDQKSY